MAKRKVDPGSPVPEWVVTYGDMMSLLLCFFILLAAFSELKQPKNYQRVMDSVKEALGMKGGVGKIAMPMNPRNSNLNQASQHTRTQPGDNRSRASQNTPNMSGKEDAVSKVHEGSRFVVGGQILFEAGSYEITDRARESIINDVAPQIRDLNDVVVIRGHAWGESDLRSGLSLREISFRRALAVYDLLVREAGVRELILRIESVGATEPRTLDRGSAQADPENRRVEIFRTEASVDELHPDPEGTGRNSAKP